MTQWWSRETLGMSGVIKFVVEGQTGLFKNYWCEKKQLFSSSSGDNLTLQGYSFQTSGPILMFKKPIVSVFEALQLGWKIYGLYEKIWCVVAAESMTWSTAKFDSKSEASMP